jgi:hypothetical protein
MAASTKPGPQARLGRLLAALAACCLAAVALPRLALAAGPRVGIAPFIHEVPNIRNGLAALFTQELQGNGRMEMIAPGTVARTLYDRTTLEQAFAEGLSAEQRVALAPEMDYVLLGKLTAFNLAGKDKLVDASPDWHDLSRRLGGDNEVAHCALEMRLVDLHTGEELLRASVEGLESKHGTRLKYLSYGWLGTVDVTTDEFRRTTLGRATYKALGALLYQLYPHFPITGKVLALSGASAVLDLDDRSGLKVGDEVAIFAAEPITSSAGEQVWTAERRVAGGKVIELKPGRTLCLLLDGAMQVKEGDLVRPLQEHWVVPAETEEVK